MSRPTLPSAVLEAIEECIKAAEKYGFHCGGIGGRAEQARAELKFKKVQESRQALVQTIEVHVASVYEGGIEIGLAQTQAQGTR